MVENRYYDSSWSDPLQLATKHWIEAVQKYYEREKNRNELTQVFAKGYFAGWSEREVAQLADKLEKMEKEYPLWDKNQ